MAQGGKLKTKAIAHCCHQRSTGVCSVSYFVQHARGKGGGGPAGVLYRTRYHLTRGISFTDRLYHFAFILLHHTQALRSLYGASRTRPRGFSFSSVLAWLPQIVWSELSLVCNLEVSRLIRISTFHIICGRCIRHRL